MTKTPTWMKRKAVMSALGFSRSVFERLVPELPEEARRRTPGGFEWNLETVRACREKQLADAAEARTMKRRALAEAKARARAAVDPAAELDPLMAGGDRSPALERYREWRSLRERLAYQKECGELVPRQMWRATLEVLSSRLRSAGEALQKVGGGEAQDILDEVIDDVRNHLQTIGEQLENGAFTHEKDQ